ncbi:Acg family FMN-binding oxidoreductase [Nocardia sp. NPDC057663]|uniref:Acg family FMN-binding oxidoreductase n=1 Tax=Nocardia sp. NPDC057663 TaxID=3346201 RepID=UPI00366EDB43
MSDEPVPRAPGAPTIRAAIELGCRAPSIHNTQPWRWVLDGTRLHLWRDTERHLYAADPHGRQAVISCGAVLHHVQTAFASHCWHTDVVRLPDPTRPDLLATLEFQPWSHPPIGIFRRAEAIQRRYTDRLPMTEPFGWASVRLVLDALVEDHDLTLDVLDEDARARLAVASEQSGALRAYDPRYQAEIGWWAGHLDTAEGVPPSALVSDSERARVGIARDFPTPGPSARRGELRDRAHLAVLTATDESPMTWLHAGEALSALLLECTASGLSTCALTHITELVSGRRLLSSLIGHPGVPQVIVRIGVAPEQDQPPPTPRRPLTDVFTEKRASP